MKTKQIKSSSLAGAKGGSHKMAGKSGAAKVEPGTISLGGRSGNNSFSPDTGPSGKMAGKSGAAPVQSGGVSVGGRPDATFGARGGKGRMAGKTGSNTVKSA